MWRTPCGLNAVIENAALVVDDIAGTGHGAGAAGETLIRENKRTVFRNADGSGWAHALAETAANAACFADIAADGVLVGAENDNGVVLQTQMDDALWAVKIADAAADAFLLIDLRNAV